MIAVRLNREHLCDVLDTQKGSFGRVASVYVAVAEDEERGRALSLCCELRRPPTGRELPVRGPPL